MAVSSEDIKLKVVIDTEGADLTGINQVDKSLTDMGQSGESAINRITAAVSSLNNQGASVASAGDGLKSITSNASATENSLNSLGKELAQVHSQLANLRSGTEAFDALKSKSQELQSQIQQLKGATTQIVSPSTITNTKALNSSLVDISRVISDMPYGMQGIANNLQQLPFSFGRLRAEAEASNQTMSSMLVQGIMSPMGVGIAVAAVTAIWVAWDMYGAKVKSVFNTVGAETESYKGKLEDIAKYSSMEFEIKVKGLDKLDALSLKIDDLQSRLSDLRRAVSNQAVIDKGPGYSDARSSIKAVITGDYTAITTQNDKYYSAVKDENDRMYSRVKSMMTGASTLNVEIWKQYAKELGMKEPTTAQIQEATLLGKIKEADSELKNTKDKKTSSTTESVAGWNSYATAINSANAYLDKQESAQLSVTDAETAAKTAREKLTAATKLSATTDDGWRVIGEKLTNAQKDAAAADEVLKQKRAAYTHTLKEGNAEVIKAEKILGTYTDTTLSMADAQDEVKKALAEYNAEKALGESHSEQLKAAEERLKSSIENQTQSLAKQKEEMQKVSAAVDSIGVAFESMTGTAISNLSAISSAFSKLVVQLQDGTGSETNKTTGLSNTTTSALNLASSVSSKGSTVNNVATGATAGATTANALSSILGFGGVTGAIIGGVVGLASSIFGGGASAQDVATAQSNASSGASTISSAASAGNSVAQEIMRRAGYSTTTLSTSTKMSDLSGMGLDQYMGTNVKDYGLFYTKENNYNATLTDAVRDIGKIESSINKFANASVVQTLADIKYKWDAIEATVGVSADTAKARISEIFTSVLSLSADTVGTAISSSFTDYSGYSSAGAKAATTISDSLITSFRDYDLSSKISDVIMPLYEEYLTPYLNMINDGVEMTSSDYAKISETVSTLKSKTTEITDGYYKVYEAAGLLTSSETALTTASTTAAESVTTLADALTTAKSTTTSALADLKTSVDAQKTKLTTEYNAATSAINAELTAVNANISSLTTLGSSLTSTLNSMTLAGSSYAKRMAAEAEISAAALQAITLGVLPINGELTNALSVVTSDASSMFATELEYKRDFYTTANNIAAINRVTKTQQTAAEKQVDILNKQLTVLTDTYDAESTALDDIYNEAKTQVDTLNSIDDSVKSVTEAVNALADAILTQKSAQTAVDNNTTKSATSYVDTATLTTSQANIEVLYENLLGRKADQAGMDYWTTALANNAGSSINDVAAAIQSSKEYKSLSAHASGGVASGWFIAGDGAGSGSGTELINTGSTEARIYSHKQSQSLLDMAPLLETLDRLSGQFAALQENTSAELLTIANNTRRTANGIDQQNELVGAGV